MRDLARAFREGVREGERFAFERAAHMAAEAATLPELAGRPGLGLQLRELARELARLGGNGELAGRLGQARICRICRCTDTKACAGGCRWITDDMCSRCAGVPS